MDNNKFEQIVKKAVADHHNASNDPGLSQITEDDVKTRICAGSVS